MKKLVSILLALALALGLCACAAPAAEEAPSAAQDPVAEAPAAEAPAAEAPAAEEPAEAEYNIGVIQLTQHAALDAACKGFIEGLEASGLNVNIDVQNAQGEQAICSTIATKFVNDKVDLIMAIATPAAQAAAQATKDIPILVTAVTDPASAGLVASNEKPGGNVSGTSDMNPVAEQIGLLNKIAPEAKTIGILYNSSEDNSILQAAMAVQAIEALGLTAEEYTAADSSTVQSVTQTACGNVDAIYIPTDNLFADSMATVGMIAGPAGVPVICGEANMVMAGGLATYGISYEQLGLQTAAQAVRILSEGADISAMPIEYCSADLELTINEDMAATLGIALPEDL